MIRKIGTAMQSGSSVRVYSEKNQILFSKTGTLVGYTSSTVTIKSGSTNRTYDEKGRCLFSKTSK